MVFLENFYEILLLVHLFATFVLVGSMTHNLLIVIGYVRGKFGRQKLEWLYVRVSLWAYTIVYVIGVLIYPAYGARIPHPYFDPKLPEPPGCLKSRNIGVLWDWRCSSRFIFCAKVFSRLRKKKSCSFTYRSVYC